jgi:hypothetical protein
VTNTKINISTAVYTAVPTVHLVTKKSMNVTWARAVSVDPENRKSKNLFTPCLLGVLIVFHPRIRGRKNLIKISTETVYHDFYIQLAATVPRYMVPGYPGTKFSTGNILNCFERYIVMSTAIQLCTLEQIEKQVTT